MMASFTIDDYKNALLADKILSPEKIKNRREKLVIWKKGKKIYFIEDEEIINKFLAVTKDADQEMIVTELKGMVANRGKVKGAIRIVKSINIDQVLKDYPNDVTLVFKHFPLTSIHPYAKPAAVASECANAQGKFWQMYDKLFTLNQNSTLSTDTISQAAVELGLK